MDRDEIEERALAYINKLSEALNLGHPAYRDISEIQVADLVEINCRLLGLNYDDYIPSLDRPWEDVRGVIFSLQDRYGRDKFQHLNPKLIVQHNLFHVTCLLQVFNAIYEHGFLPSTNNQEATILDDSLREIDALADTTEVSENEVNTSNSTIEEVKFKFILDGSEENSDIENLQDSAISTDNNEVSDNEANASDSTIEEVKFKFILDGSEENSDFKNTQDSAISTDNNDSYESDEIDFSEPDDGPLHDKGSKSNKDSSEKRRNRQSVWHKPPESTQKSSKKADQELELPSTSSRQNASTVEDSRKKTSRKPKVIATGTIFDNRSNTNDPANMGAGCDHAEIERFTAEAIEKLNQLNNDVQQQLKDRLAKMEERLCNPPDVRDSQAHARRSKSKTCGPEKRRNKMLAPCVGVAKPGPIKYDPLGNPYRERFPYYPGGIIKLECHPCTTRKGRDHKKSEKHLKTDTATNILQKAKVEALSLDLDEQFKVLQKMYKNELKLLREEFLKLTNQGGPKTFENIRAAWSLSHHRVKQEMTRIMERIIGIIDSIAISPSS